jgi:glycosyltransferase involved in cell wall biosynthesis
LAANVHFLGFRNDLWELLAASDIVVMSSLWEGLPYFLLQAMAAGRPIVCTQVGACAEVLDEGKCGVLVPPANGCLLAEGISRLAEDRSLAQILGGRGRERALSCFGAAEMVQQVQNMYEAVLGARSRILEAGVA